MNPNLICFLFYCWLCRSAHPGPLHLPGLVMLHTQIYEDRDGTRTLYNTS